MVEQAGTWKLLFGDTCVKPGPLPDPIEEDTLYVDGSPLRIIEVKQADIHPTSIVHIPEIDVVVAADSIYDEIHPMLGLSTPAEWQDWLETIDLIESLEPKAIVGGHRRPDGDERAVTRMIADTRSYIQDFAAAFEVAKDVEELVGMMATKYPHHGNLWSLMFSAGNAIAARNNAASSTDAVADAVAESLT